MAILSFFLNCCKDEQTVGNVQMGYIMKLTEKKRELKSEMKVGKIVKTIGYCEFLITTVSRLNLVIYETLDAFHGRVRRQSATRQDGGDI